MDIHQSMERILESQDSVGEQFYIEFFIRCPDARPYFQGIDMPQQAVVLTMALTVVEQYYESPNITTKRYLQILGERHRKRGIPDHLYARWADAMLQTLASFHQPDWTDRLAAQWRGAIEKSIRVMIAPA